MRYVHFVILFAAMLVCHHVEAKNNSSKKTKPLVLLLFGPSGSGQGVLAVKVSKSLGIPGISSADLVLGAIHDETEAGLKAKEYLNTNGSIPDQLLLDMLYDRIVRSDCKSGFLLNTLPKTLQQAQDLQRKLSKNFRIEAISIQVSESTMCERLANRLICHNCGRVYHKVLSPPKKEMICDYCKLPLAQREDDTEETVKRKLIEYEQAEAPVLDFYKKEGLLQEVNGDLGLEEILDLIVKKVRA